jgi:hypothetical protein
MSEAQCDAAATTSAERHALIKMLGLRTRLRPEDDYHNLGEHITPEQAAELEQWVESIGADRAKFLEFAKADTFAKIHSGRYDECVFMLKKKEAK